MDEMLCSRNGFTMERIFSVNSITVATVLCDRAFVALPSDEASIKGTVSFDPDYRDRGLLSCFRAVDSPTKGRAIPEFAFDDLIVLLSLARFQVS